MILPATRVCASDADPAAVTTGDPFGIELVAYNTTDPSGDFYAINPTLSPTFGTPQAFTGDAANDQTLTVTSAESTSGGTTTDTIVVSVPTGFIPAGTVDNNGNIVNALEFSIGTYNGGTSPLDFSTAITGLTVTGSCTYTFDGAPASAGLTNTTMLNNGTAFSAEEAVQSGTINGTDNTAPISDYNINSFSFTITYAAVPEPSTVATMLLGAAGLLWIVARRRATV